MQFDKPRANGWGRPNLVHTVEEKTSKAKWKKKMIRQGDNQAPTSSHVQDFKCV
jgi:hypothetical protein